MSFNVLAVREIGTHEDPLYPVPGNQPDSVQLDAEDGQPSSPLVASEIIVREIQPGGMPKRLMRLNDVKAALQITNSRVVVACSKYDKGGGWTPWSPGAVPIALTANLISKSRASKRRTGKMLVGQVPYKWLLSVGCKPRSTPMGHDHLRIGTVDPTQRTFRGLLLDFTLSRQEAGVDIARRITGVAAAHRLDGGGDMNDALREHLTGLREPASLQTQPKQFASYFLISNADPRLMSALQKA